MRKVYSISLSDEKIVNHLDKISNKSQYIKELILKDMKKEPFSKEQISYIQKMINEYRGYSRHSEDYEQQKETVLALDDLLNDF